MKGFKLCFQRSNEPEAFWDSKAGSENKKNSRVLVWYRIVFLPMTLLVRKPDSAKSALEFHSVRLIPRRLEVLKAM
jgi:hypothetical protein